VIFLAAHTAHGLSIYDAIMELRPIYSTLMLRICNNCGILINKIDVFSPNFIFWEFCTTTKYLVILYCLLDDSVLLQY